MVVLFAIIVGLCSLLIGALIQWLNMKDVPKFVIEIEIYQAKKQIESLVEQFNFLSEEAHDMSHDEDYSDSAREQHIVVAETWTRAANCAEYLLREVEDRYDSIRSKNRF